MNENARKDQNSRSVMLGTSPENELRNLRVTDEGKVIVQFVPKNENYTERNENAIADGDRIPCALGVTPSGKIRRVQFTNGGFLNLVFK